jgi:thiol-disulfide isomerase/thioredoxin
MSYVYYDNRSEFWKKYWNMAFDFDTYIQNIKPNEQESWLERNQRSPELTIEQKERFSGFDRELNVLIYAGAWCGDCSRQVPMLLKMAEAAGEKVNIRIIERDTSKELQEELKIVGALRVPMVVFLSEDFWEIGRFGERLLSVYRSKAAREIGRGTDRGVLSPRPLERELSDWLDIFERMLIMVRLSPPLRKRHKD